MLIVPSGTVTIMIKAVDFAGNESINSATIVTDLGDPIVANVVETFDRKAAGFPGVKTGCSVSGGNLVADSITPLMWDPNDGANMWSADPLTPMWATTQFSAMTYVDELIFSKSVIGSNLTISSTILGDPWSLEYREISSKLMWNADSGVLMWSSDSNLLWDSPPYLSWQGSCQSSPLSWMHQTRMSS